MSTYITKLAKEKNLKMVDAKRPLQLEVTSSDIARAQLKNSKCCAFARASKRTIDGIKGAYFFRSCAWLEYDNKLVRYALPSSVQKEIVAFDRNRTMEPGQYQISPPSKIDRLGVQAAIKRATRMTLQLSKPTGSGTIAAARARSKKRPGRHEPAGGAIKRKYLHRTTGVRSMFEPQ